VKTQIPLTKIQNQ